MTEANPPEVSLAPAPWDLQGHGYIFFVRMPEALIEHGSFVEPNLRRASNSRIAIAMFVDYADTDVGPYRELLYIPGKYHFGAQRHFSISRIFVSSRASVINGQNNWGIPKAQCEFDTRYADTDEIQLTAEDTSPFARMRLQAFGPRLPAPLSWTPASWRTLSQQRDGRQFTYAPSASGHFRFARVLDWQFDGNRFPDLAAGKLLAAFKITDFRMTFPVASVLQLGN